VENLVFRGKRAMKDLIGDETSATGASKAGAVGAAPGKGQAPALEQGAPCGPCAAPGGDGA